MRMLSLCSGIGGADLAAEWAGIEVVGQVEIDRFCCAILAKYWPDVKRIRDVREVQGDEFGPVDSIVAGFPCQPHSYAGLMRATRDERNLWPEIERVIAAIRPRWIVLENVQGLLNTEGGQFFGSIITTLASLGYRVGWSVYGAYEVGASHQRRRVFLVAYNGIMSHQQRSLSTDQERQEQTATQQTGMGREVERATIMAYPPRDDARVDECGAQTQDARPSHEREISRSDRRRADQSDLGGDDDGFPARMDRFPAPPCQEQHNWEPERIGPKNRHNARRLRGLGNAIVPQQLLPLLQEIVKVDTMQPDIRFYCGVSERHWNHHPVKPCGHACISPVYGRSVASKATTRAWVPADTAILLDSGAFCDSSRDRLSFESALARQVAHAHRFGYAQQVTHVASYDLLIDEHWSEQGKRKKQRWSQDEAEFAVQETIRAARYLADHRHDIGKSFGHTIGLVLSAQGVHVGQYMQCLAQIVPLVSEQEGDTIGLGGWCITGMFPQLIFPSFCEVMQEALPFLADHGVSRVHLWGVIFPRALAFLLRLCQAHRISLSTDSAGPSIFPVMGKWGYGSWIDRSYKRAPIQESCKHLDEHGCKSPLCSATRTRCRGLERTRHVQATHDWLAHFSESRDFLSSGER